MEFSSLWYLPFWSIISQVSLVIAFFVSTKLGTCFDPTSVALLSFPLSIHAIFSSFYALFLRPMMEPGLNNPDIKSVVVWVSIRLSLKMIVFVFHINWYRFFRGFPNFDVVSGVLSIPWILCFYYFLFIRLVKSIELGELLTGFVGPFVVYPFHSLCFALSTVSLFLILHFASCQGLSEAMGNCPFDICFYLMMLFIAFFLVVYIPLYTELTRSGRLTYIHEIPLFMLGGLLAHYFIQEKSVCLLLMLSSGACYLLANLAMTQPAIDLGIFNFFIGAILDCALSLYGLSKFTWISFVYCVVLGLVRWKLKSVTLRYPDRKTIMRNCIKLEKEIWKADFN